MDSPSILLQLDHNYPQIKNRGIMILPNEFVQENADYLNKYVKLTTASGESWNITILLHQNRSRSEKFWYLGKMKTFIQFVHLSRSDYLVLHLTAPKTFVATVYDKKGREKRQSSNNDAKPSSMPASVSTSKIHKRPTVTNEIEFEAAPQFEFEFTNGQRSRMTLRKKFVIESSMQDRENITVQYEGEKKKWNINLGKRRPPSYIYELKGTWTNFVRSIPLMNGAHYKVIFDRTKESIIVPKSN